MKKELVMYSRTLGCPFITTARRVLAAHHVPYRVIHIDKDPTAKKRVLDWTGFLSVPTLIVAEIGQDLPFTPPAPLQDRTSPRGIDRGSMITEPGTTQLENWLEKHGFIEQVSEQT